MLAFGRLLRSAFVAFLGLGLVATASSCGGEPGDSAGADETSGSTVEVEHRFGTTEVPVDPERVVTLDLQWTDTMLAIGVEPVGYGEDAVMPGGGPPWWSEKRSGDALDLQDGVPLEKIASLEPDLILATFSIGDQATYDKLSELAPTIAGEGANYVADWPKLLETAGRFLDAEDKATKVRKSVEAEIGRASDDLPKLDGKTFALAQYIVGDAVYVVADEEDGSSRLFRQLGMRLLPVVAEQGERSGEPRVKISTERADLLTADFLAFLVNGGDQSDLADIPGFEQLPASQSGSAAILDYATTVGLNTPTPLSIPYALDKLRPYLENVGA